MTDSVARQPRGLINLNGHTLPNWIDFEIEQNSFYSADTFQINFRADAVNTEALLSKTKPLLFEVFAGLPPSASAYTPQGLTSLILGEADELEYDVGQQTFCARGRDLTARFIDNKTIKRWQDQTASQIAYDLARAHGLAADVTPTQGRAGKQYILNEYARMTDERSQWDILAWLAHENGYIVFVSGKTLYFGPPIEDAQPYQLVYTKADGAASGVATFPGRSIQVRRNMTVARGVTVTVLSHTIKDGSVPVRQSFPRSPRGVQPGASAAPTQNYYVVKAGLNADQAYQLAQKTQKEISQHELRLSAQLPGDTALSIRRQIQLRGTGTDFDQLYFPDNITFRMSLESGFTMNVEAKNISAENAAAVAA